MNICIVLVCFYASVLFAQDTIKVEESSVELCSNGTEDSCEAFNSTELSTQSTVVEGASEIVKTTVPTKKPKTTTIKPVIKKPSLTPNITSTKPHPHCTCDFTHGDCEINCCCDVDCSSEQHAVFTHCISIPQMVDSDYCFPQQLLHHNNTDYQTVQTDPGVLCVVQQNTHSSTDFIDVPVLKTVSTFEKKLGRNRYYSWYNPVISSPQFDIGTSYKKGSPIWISDNSSITPLVFPVVAGHWTMCHSTMMPLYLEETVASCTRSLSSITDCLISSENHFAVISSPQNFNFTHPQECTEDICLPVHQYVCSEFCTEGRIPIAKFNNLSKTCENVVKSVEYKIYHNGSQGILDVKAFYVFKNITVDSDKVFRKHYKITYVWSGTSSQPVLKRSGRPGYEIGKPIISGRLNSKVVTFNFSASDWISVGISGSSGYCLHRRNLLFKENMLSQCLFIVNGTCNDIQKQIWKQLLGSSVNLTELMLSSYGDPRMELETWLPLLRGEVPPLPTLTTAIEIIIVYTLVGSVASPQAKIIGAFLELFPSGITCDSNYSTVMLRTSVKFIDKTTPTVTKFAEPPVYEIKLPQDFFYPFLSVGFMNDNCSSLVLLLAFIVIVFNWSSGIFYS